MNKFNLYTNTHEVDETLNKSRYSNDREKLIFKAHFILKAKHGYNANITNRDVALLVNDWITIA